MSTKIHTPQYSPESISRYEKIFGRDFVSSGGLSTTEAFTRELGLRPGMRVLDVGCGLGGSAFYLARTYAVKVLGVDLLPQMVEEAKRRAAEYRLDSIEFVCEDIFQAPLEAESFDLIYSRDAFLHIHDKVRLFSKLLSVLRPGGTLFLTDYARGPEPHSEAFSNYRLTNGYDLLELVAYRDVVASAGFVDVEVTDLSEPFVEVLRSEVTTARAIPEREIEEKDRGYLIDRWERKIVFCSEGDMRWCSIRARRP